MSESSSQSLSVASTVKRMENSTRSCTENMATSSRQHRADLYGADKENRVRKDTDCSGSVVKRIKMRYEEISNSRKFVTIRDAAVNATTTGAIKKRVDKTIENREEKIVGPKKRVAIREDDVFAKSRFKVYADKKARIEKESVETKSAETHDSGVPIGNVQQRPQNRNLTSLLRTAEPSASTVQPRFTPIDVPVVPLIPKKVKVEHRRSSKKGTEEPKSQINFASRGWPFKFPYRDDFIKTEMEKDEWLLRGSRGFRERNITVEQRKIILKFLIRLNAHSFYPSFFLYQTMRIFDAAVDAKPINVENLQLTALASMWIAIKRDHTVYSIPSAEKMISFSNDLYAGRTDLLVKCERDILQSLNYDIAFPEPFSVLWFAVTTSECFCSMNDNQIDLAYYCGGYMIDLSLFDDDLMHTSAILLAATAAETALYFVLGEVKSGSEPPWHKWRSSLAMKKYSEGEISRVRSRLIEKIGESSRRHTDGDIIYKKYSRSRYGKISRYLGSKVRLFLAPECSIDLKE